MVDPTTTNRGFTVPTRGSDTGTWDTPLNNNFNTLDTILSGVTTLSMSSSGVTLTLTQANAGVIRITGSPSTSLSVIFPQNMAGFWIIENLSTSTNFYINFYNNNGSGSNAGDVVTVPAGSRMGIFSDGSNMRFANDGVSFPGSYKMYSGTALPAWVTACTKQPWLICDGTTYNVSTYPTLGALLGSTYGGNGSTTFAVPDLKGRIPLPLDSTGARITVAGCGINGNVLGAAGGEQSHVLIETELPALTKTFNSTNTYAPASKRVTDNTNGAASAFTAQATANTGSAVAGAGSGLIYLQPLFFQPDPFTPTGNVSFGSNGPHNNVQPSLMAGIMLIKT